MKSVIQVFLIIMLSFGICFAQVAPGNAVSTGTLQVHPFIPTPSPEVMEEWRKSFHEDMPEIWVIKNPDEFSALLKSSGANNTVFDILNSRVRTELSTTEVLKAHSFMGDFIPKDSSKHVFVLLTAEDKAKIPEGLLKRVYMHLGLNNVNPHTERFSSQEELITTLRLWGNGDAVIGQALLNTVQNDGSHYLFLWPELWKAMSEMTRDMIIQGKLRNNVTNRGLKLDLTVTAKDDLAEVAKKYAGTREFTVGGKIPYWQVLQRYLQLQLKKAGGQTVTIPLERIMPPFIRHQLNTFAACNGANCHNAGLSVNEAHSYEQEYTNADGLLKERVFPNYDKVYGENALKTGDLLMYFSTDNKLIHSATYITRHEGQDILFSKNGLQKTNAYVYATRKQVESLYFGNANGQYHLAIFRPKPAVEFNSCEKLLGAR